MANTYSIRYKPTELCEAHIDALSDPTHNTICPIKLLLIVVLHTNKRMPPSLIHSTTQPPKTKRLSGEILATRSCANFATDKGYGNRRRLSSRLCASFPFYFLWICQGAYLFICWMYLWVWKLFVHYGSCSARLAVDKKHKEAEEVANTFTFVQNLVELENVDEWYFYFAVMDNRLGSCLDWTEALHDWAAWSLAIFYYTLMVVWEHCYIVYINYRGRI